MTNPFKRQMGDSTVEQWTHRAAVRADWNRGIERQPEALVHDSGRAEILAMGSHPYLRQATSYGVRLDGEWVTRGGTTMIKSFPTVEAARAYAEKAL